MADGTVLNSGTGGDDIFTEDTGTTDASGRPVKLAATKLILGGKGVNGGDVSPQNPLPTEAASVVEALQDVLACLREIECQLPELLSRTPGFMSTGLVVREAGSIVNRAVVYQPIAFSNSMQVLGSNAGRRGLYFYNDSSSQVFLLFGTGTVSSSNFSVKLLANAYYEFPQPCFTGPLQALWTSGAGNARITEVF